MQRGRYRESLRFGTMTAIRGTGEGRDTAVFIVRSAHAIPLAFESTEDSEVPSVRPTRAPVRKCPMLCSCRELHARDRWLFLAMDGRYPWLRILTHGIILVNDAT